MNFMKKQPYLDIYFYAAGWAIIGVVVLAFVVSMILQIPITELFPPCMLYTLTGWYCPGCGGTRAMNYLVHGRVIISFLYYPFVPFATIGGLWFMISQTIDRIVGRKFKAVMHFRMIYVYIAIALIVINFLVKNAFILFANIHLIG